MTGLVLAIATTLLCLPLGLWLVFLTGLAVVSAVSRTDGGTAATTPGARPLRLAVLIAAHDEEALIGDTVASVLDADYPADMRRVFVVADNCTDDTAVLAGVAGAEVFVRDDPAHRGKSRALDFGLRHLPGDWPWEAVVFCDADGLLEPQYLRRAANGLTTRRVFQGACRVADADRNWFTRLTALAFILKNDWQFPGLARLGLPLPLRGACLAIRRDLLESLPAASGGLTEDLDLSITLMERGEAVTYDPAAIIHSYMPATPALARSQRERWSAGEAEARKHRLGGLLLQSLCSLRPGRALGCLYLGAPPFSALLALACVAALCGLGTSLITQHPGWMLAGLGVLALYAAYFLLSLGVAGWNRRNLASLAMIPVYAIWRVGIHARCALGKRPDGDAWIRTARPDPTGPRVSAPKHGSHERKLRIALIGTRGPGRYGGFETCVAELGKRFAAMGHDVTVYCRASHFSDRPAAMDGMRLVYAPCLRFKAAETLSHTLASVIHALFCRYDVHMVFNAANAPLALLLRAAGKRVCINPDGLEWRRGKWGKLGKTYYKLSETIACLAANRLITDAEALRNYYLKVHDTDSTAIPYGAYPQCSLTPTLLAGLGLTPGGYFLQITRFEPENNPLLTLRAFMRLRSDKKLVLVGGCAYPGPYTMQLGHEAAQAGDTVVLPGCIYDPELLRELWCNAFAYVHGNEVGGTNPALLQAMASGAFILARDVVFNREVLGDAGIYFKPEVSRLADAMRWALDHADRLDAYREEARERTRTLYDWDAVALRYLDVFQDVAKKQAPFSE